jgi:hypothetical protein
MNLTYKNKIIKLCRLSKERRESSMAFIYGVLSEEYERLKEKKQDYEEKLKQLPKGALVKKRINGREYNYLMYRVNDKVKTEYIKEERLNEIHLQLERRKKIEKSLSSIKQDISIIEKVVKNE